MTHYYHFKKRLQLPSLQQVCVQVLIDNKHTLGERGFSDDFTLRRLYGQEIPEELQRIEDQTMEKSGIDIRWDTWQIWKRLYMSKYGKPNPDDVPELRAELCRAVDLDHLPEGLGDYRALYEQKLRQTEAQRMKLAEKLRKMKKNEQISREKTKARRIDSVTPRRHRSRTPSKNNLKTTSSKRSFLQQDFFQKLGLPPKSRPIFKRR